MHRSCYVKPLETGMESSQHGRLGKSSAVFRRRIREAMSHAWTYKAGIFHVNPAMEEGAKSPAQERTNFRSMRCWADHVALPHPSPPLSPPAESTRRRPAAPMETVVGKHPSPSQQRCHAVCAGAESGSGVVANRPAADFRVQSPSDASSLFSSRASSRESLLSDGWDRERSWSAMQLSGAASPPLSPSRAVSPCSSARSGAFTPTVLRVRRHALASGASMLHLPRASCQSSCESLAESEGARSPPPPPPRRHRPPLTRLSLLTAILRKGRLPVLSPALQRPYSPCWPINHITLASCTACSAASRLPPVSPRAALSPSPPGPPDAEPPTQSRWDWDSFRQRPALPSVRLPDGRGAGPRPAETPASESSYRAGERPVFQTVFSRPVAGPAALRATGGERGVPPPQSAAPRPRAGPANGADPAGPDEGTEPTRPPPSRPCCYSGARSPGPKRGANQTDPGSSADEPRQTSPAEQKQPSLKTTAAGNLSARRVCSPPPLPATARLDCISPPPRSLQSCLKQHRPFASQTQSHSHEPPKYPATKSPAPGNTSIPGLGPVDSPRDVTSPAPVPRSSSCLSPSRCAAVVFPGWPSPNGSRSCTPDRFTLSPSPASQARDLTPRPSPCPSPSLRSTPSPRPGSRGSDCTDREGNKRKPHKIKSSYKSLAAIPTNTLLLDQQMCSPAQLRQESEELYAVIDKILEDGVPKTKVSSLSAQPSGESSHLVTGLKQPQLNSTGRPTGRETKYATVRSPTPLSLERIPAETQTKPGVIRPMIAIPRPRVEGRAGANRCNPFARYLVDTPAAPSSAVGRTICQSQAEDGGLGSRSPPRSEGGSLEDVGTKSTSALFILESEELRPPPVKPASWQGASTTFSRAEVLPEAFDTRI
ncbi:muscular LMNA-interacting protein isoform X2 [Gadus macrocephalus]|uniref:muscular LMNA-interacting protein isoform X2 n=1 Tax=Gadus macrocephalus TaxID=80720 RepID=UPI0028CBAE56|nr:muscular LMNA-interacting protein isoform X2 [Gadus macrocephalus]